MKGIIFGLTEEVVRGTYGEDTWDGVLDRAGLDGVWTPLGNYPDEQLSRVVAAAAALLGVDRQTVLRTVAQGAFPLLAQRYPHFFTPQDNTRDFVLTLNDVIHKEVFKLHPGATPPEFGFEQAAASLTLTYTSPRRLCWLAEGFLHGAAAHYGQTVTITQPACMMRGEDRCLLHCVFADAPA